MPTVTNVSSDDLNMPSVGGMSLAAGETKEVSDEVAVELDDHPLLHVDYDVPAGGPTPATETVPAADPTPEPPAYEE